MIWAFWAPQICIHLHSCVNKMVNPPKKRFGVLDHLLNAFLVSRVNLQSLRDKFGSLEILAMSADFNGLLCSFDIDVRTD